MSLTGNDPRPKVIYCLPIPSLTYFFLRFVYRFPISSQKFSIRFRISSQKRAHACYAALLHVCCICATLRTDRQTCKQHPIKASGSFSNSNFYRVHHCFILFLVRMFNGSMMNFFRKKNAEICIYIVK